MSVCLAETTHTRVCVCVCVCQAVVTQIAEAGDELHDE